ncbi:MAG: type II toxin-antitoxin system HicB family antitoxin [Acidobacteria bacterium]|nr:type II toxin-antitoxin system HicB family antitoxin [Acidobacteriota bacterium]
MPKLTAVFEEQRDGSWIGWVEELPGANTQGDSLDEAKENIFEAIELVLEAQREIAEEELTHRAAVGQIVREELCFG